MDIVSYCLIKYQLTSNMGGRDCFQVGNKYLKNSNYYLPLNKDCYIAAYQERIIIGHVEDFDDDNATVASIQKLFFQTITMVHFSKNFSVFAIHKCTEFNKMHLFLEIFRVQVLFKSILYWPRYTRCN